MKRLLDQRRDAYRRKRPNVASRRKQNEVIVENGASRLFTVIEVIAHDRTGLLCTITGRLADLGLDIHLAKIATEADRAIDVFYVRERNGGKVESATRQEEIRATLLEALARLT